MALKTLYFAQFSISATDDWGALKLEWAILQYPSNTTWLVLIFQLTHKCWFLGTQNPLMLGQLWVWVWKKICKSKLVYCLQEYVFKSLVGVPWTIQEAKRASVEEFGTPKRSTYGWFQNLKPLWFNFWDHVVLPIPFSRLSDNYWARYQRGPKSWFWRDLGFWVLKVWILKKPFHGFKIHPLAAT